MQVSKNQKGSVNFELNLIPFIDILSTCICFLLMTTVFIQLATLDNKQGMGNETISGEKSPPSLMVKLEENGNVRLLLKDVAESPLGREMTIQLSNADDWSEVSQKIAMFKESIPELNTALVLPSKTSRYNDLIKAMDELKKNSFTNLGISPL